LIKILGTRYDGRFHLAGDLAATRELGFDPADSRTMSGFYGTRAEIPSQG
jgi:hypothetical protein